jgi:hypothetical protein
MLKALTRAHTVYLTRLTLSKGTHILASTMAAEVTDSTPSAEATPAFVDTSSEAGPSKRTAAEKWHNPEGPPVGSNFGARLLDDAQDVWSHNAW